MPERNIPFRASITGPDGSGKSTTLENVARRLSASEKVVALPSLKSPYSIENGERRTYYLILLGAIEGIEAMGERFDSKPVVACASALFVLTQGRIIEPGLIKKVNPTVLLAERDIIVDSLVICKSYSRLFASGDQESNLAFLERVSGVSLKDLIVLLTIPAETALQRIEQRVRNAESMPRRRFFNRPAKLQMHEEVETLSRNQDEYKSILEFLQRTRGISTAEIDASLSQDEVSGHVLEIINNYL